MFRIFLHFSATSAMERIGVSKYLYERLQQARGIRLLQLATRHYHSDPLTGTLLVRDLDDTGPEYTSVSYSWGRNSDGDASLSRSIRLDGHMLSITENLYDLLVQLSEPGAGETQPLWIDAVCIDQSNVAERGNQVSMMAAIYQNASDLLIWFGHGNSEAEDRDAMEALSLFQHEDQHGNKERFPTDGIVLEALGPQKTGVSMRPVQAQAFSLACKLAKLYNPWQHRKRSASRMNRFWPKLVRSALTGVSGQYYVNQAIAAFNPDQLLAQLDTRTWLDDGLGREFFDQLIAFLTKQLKALARLCARRYFQRRWIVQEIYQSRAKHTQLRWGMFSSSLTKLRNQFARLTFLLDSPLVLLHSRDWVSRELEENITKCRFDHSIAADILDVDILSGLSRGNTEDESDLLLLCLRMFQRTKCSDNRDLVYAFLSIPATRIEMIVDYSLPENVVFSRAAIALIEAGAVGQVLAVASSQRHRRLHNLLSWVPDFRLPLVAYEKVRAVGAADPDRLDDMDFDVHVAIEGDENVLRLQAKIGRVERASQHIGRVLQDISVGRYLCAIPEYTEFVTGFVLEAVHSAPLSFIIVGYWRADYYGLVKHRVWDLCEDVEIATIKIY